jgi:hypothetical protein
LFASATTADAHNGTSKLTASKIERGNGTNFMRPAVVEWSRRRVLAEQQLFMQTVWVTLCALVQRAKFNEAKAAAFGANISCSILLLCITFYTSLRF